MQAVNFLFEPPISRIDTNKTENKNLRRTEERGAKSWTAKSFSTGWEGGWVLAGEGF